MIHLKNKNSMKIGLMYFSYGCKKLFVSLLLIFFGFGLYAQQSHSIHGTVASEEDNQPLAGVTIRIKGGNTGTTTNSKGKYAIQAKVVDTLEFSFVGFLQKYVGVAIQNQINVSLNPSIIVMN